MFLSLVKAWFNIRHTEYEDLLQNYGKFDSVVYGHVIYDKGDTTEQWVKNGFVINDA